MVEPQPAWTAPLWTLRRLFVAAGMTAPRHDPIPETPVTGVFDDSRAVTPGACFVAVRGVSSDGHAFAADAVRRGAAVVVAEGPVELDRSVVVVRVGDTRAALARLAAAWHGLRDGRNPRLIGVTGTNGKTTVTWLIRSILQAAGRPTALLGTVEYDLLGERRSSPLTTPGAIELCRNLALARDRGAAFAALEVSSHALDQRRCDGLSFAAAVFTNLTGDHLDYHKTVSAYFAAKRRLFEMLAPDSVAVINRDDPRGKELAAATAATVVTYGLDGTRTDVSAEIRRMDRCGTEIVLQVRGRSWPVRMPLIGRHNVLNTLAAAATADALGVPDSAVRDGLAQVRGVPGRLQRAEPDAWPFSVFVDYAHTDDALRNVLTSLRPLTRGRLRCVFGCGGDRDRTKRPRMAAVVEELADAAYVTSDNPRTEDPLAIIDEIVSGFTDGGRLRARIEADRRRAIETALAEAGEGDCVLIAGKGHENYQIVGREVRPFDDVEIARRWLESAAMAREVA